MSLCLCIPSLLLYVSLKGTIKEYSRNFIFKIYHNLGNYYKSLKSNNNNRNLRFTNIKFSAQILNFKQGVEKARNTIEV
jgi:hypothetical protein